MVYIIKFESYQEDHDCIDCPLYLNHAWNRISILVFIIDPPQII